MLKKIRRFFRLRQAGFTMIEVLMALAIGGVAMTAIYSVFISSNRSYHTQDSVADAQQRVRVGVDFIVSDLRMAGFDPLGTALAGIEVASNTKVRVTADIDMDGTIDNANRERVTYEFANNSLRQCLYEGTASESWQTLIEDVNPTSRFSYLDANGATTTTDIRVVAITMRALAADAQGHSFSRELATRVNCRNLSM